LTTSGNPIHYNIPKRVFLAGVLLVVPVILIAPMGLSGWPRTPPAQRSANLPRQEVIASLRTLGEVEIDEDQSTKPVVKVLLRGRNVTDATLDFLGELTELRELVLDDTRVTDAGIRRLRHLKRLRRLVLDGVGITDEGLSSLTSFKELESLTLFDTRIDGTGLARLQSLDHLCDLTIEGRLLVTDGLGQLRGLTRLGLYETQRTDRGLEFLKGLTNLEELILDDETVTLQGLAILRVLPRMKILYNAGGITGFNLDVEHFGRACPNIQIKGPSCGHGSSSRKAEVIERRARRQDSRVVFAWLGDLSSGDLKSGRQERVMREDAVIVRVSELSRVRLAGLLVESEASGYRFLRRLVDEWERGVNCFSRPGEVLFAAEAGGEIVGVCGLNVDPYLDDPRIGRVRNVYVRSAYRGRGIGRRLVEEAISAARGHFDRLRLRGEEAGPARLYESLGFRACDGKPDCTHILELGR